MTVNEWVNSNYSNIQKWLKNVTRGRAPQLYEDFVHEIILIFLEHPKAQQLVDNNEARFYITRIALNQWRSQTSPWAKREFAHKWVSLYMDFEMELEEYNTEDDVIIELMIGILDDMHLGDIEEYYMSMVVMVYHELKGNFSEMSRRLDIPRTSLSKVYKQAISTIESRLQQKIKDVENGIITINGNSDLVAERWSELTSVAKRKANAIHTRAVERGFFRDL
jgi:DNA-directed RNA polymerase specialized sigma24 family protein